MIHRAAGRFLPLGWHLHQEVRRVDQWRRDPIELGDLCPPELKVSTPAHAKHLGWYLEF